MADRSEVAGTPRRAMTFEEFVAWDEEGVHGEWIDGEVVLWTTLGLRHQQLLGLALTLLSRFARQGNLGTVLHLVGMRILSGSVMRVPDVVFVAREHAERVTEGWIEGPADLVVEVLSAGSVTRDRIDKFREYELAGVREYWMFDSRPGHERADFYHLDKHGRYVPIASDEAGRFHSSVLPGFWLDPDWLWPDPHPDPVALLDLISAPANAGNRDKHPPRRR